MMRLQFIRDGSGPVLHGIAVVIGLLLAAAPWIAGFTAATTALWNAVAAGGVIALIGLAMIIHGGLPHHGYGYLALGLWTLAAPWLLGFAGVTAALWAHVAAGIVAIALGAVALWFSGNRPVSPA